MPDISPLGIRDLPTSARRLDPVQESDEEDESSGSDDSSTVRAPSPLMNRSITLMRTLSSSQIKHQAARRDRYCSAIDCEERGKVRAWIHPDDDERLSRLCEMHVSTALSGEEVEFEPDGEVVVEWTGGSRCGAWADVGDLCSAEACSASGPKWAYSNGTSGRREINLCHEHAIHMSSGQTITPRTPLDLLWRHVLADEERQRSTRGVITDPTKLYQFLGNICLGTSPQPPVTCFRPKHPSSAHCPTCITWSTELHLVLSGQLPHTCSHTCQAADCENPPVSHISGLCADDEEEFGNDRQCVVCGDQPQPLADPSGRTLMVSPLTAGMCVAHLEERAGGVDGGYVEALRRANRGEGRVGVPWWLREEAVRRRSEVNEEGRK